MDVYYGVVESYLNSLPGNSVSHRLAADTLFASVYGIIAFTRMTPTMGWSDIAKMADMIVISMLLQWSEQARLQPAAN